MRNELLVCVCVCVCGLKLVGKKSPVFSDGNIQFGPPKGMVNECVLCLVSVVSDSL